MEKDTEIASQTEAILELANRIDELTKGSFKKDLEERNYSPAEIEPETFAELSEGNDNLEELSESQRKLIEEFENAEPDEEDELEE